MCQNYTAIGPMLHVLLRLSSAIYRPTPGLAAPISHFSSAFPPHCPPLSFKIIPFSLTCFFLLYSLLPLPSLSSLTSQVFIFQPLLTLSGSAYFYSLPHGLPLPFTVALQDLVSSFHWVQLCEAHSSILSALFCDWEEQRGNSSNNQKNLDLNFCFYH